MGLVHGSENHLFEWLRKVCRAALPEGATVEHMRVDHGGACILVTEHLPDSSDILPPPEQIPVETEQRNQGLVLRGSVHLLGIGPGNRDT